MNKSFTPLFQNRDSVLNTNITDEALMEISNVFANTNLKVSKLNKRFIQDFSAALEIKINRKTVVHHFKN
jgi:hypothetical protein